MAEVKQAQLHELSSAWEPPHIKEEPKSPHIKEELEDQELCLKQEPEEFPFHIITVKTEDDEDEFSGLRQTPTEENGKETDGRGSDPPVQSHSDSDEHSDSSDHTDHSEDYCQEQSSSKRSYAMIPPESSVTDHKPCSRSDRRPFSCSFCGKAYKWNSELRRHMSIHTGERPHKCFVCERSFKEKFDLKVHMRTHTAERPYVCTVCEKAFKYKSDLPRHLKNIHCICPVCEMRFSDQIQLDAHRKTHVEARTVGVEDIKPYSCSDCGLRFRIYSKLQRHKIIHTGEKPFKCSVCERAFNTKASLLHHLKQVHLICPVCKERFPNKVKLTPHLRTHVEEGTLGQSALKSMNTVKSCSCSECGKRFKCETDVKRHMLVHTGEKPHKCSVCEKAFTQKGSLKAHMRIHTGERPFICSVCEKGFAKDFNLKKHLKTHGEKGRNSDTSLTKAGDG